MSSMGLWPMALGEVLSELSAQFTYLHSAVSYYRSVILCTFIIRDIMLGCQDKG